MEIFLEAYVEDPECIALDLDATDDPLYGDHEGGDGYYRLYFSSAYTLIMHALRRIGLQATELANAQCDTIRLKLLKIGAQIRVTERNIGSVVTILESNSFLQSTIVC